MAWFSFPPPAFPNPKALLVVSSPVVVFRRWLPTYPPQEPPFAADVSKLTAETPRKKALISGCRAKKFSDFQCAAHAIRRQLYETPLGKWTNHLLVGFLRLVGGASSPLIAVPVAVGQKCVAKIKPGYMQTWPIWTCPVLVERLGFSAWLHQGQTESK